MEALGASSILGLLEAVTFLHPPPRGRGCKNMTPKERDDLRDHMS